MLEAETAPQFAELKARLVKLTDRFEEATNIVTSSADKEVHDFLARRLYEMTGTLVMSLLLLDDATRAPELFTKSLNVYVRMIEAESAGHYEFIKNFEAESLEHYRALQAETAEE